MNTYMIGVTLIDAKNETIAKRKYARLTTKLRAKEARERKETQKWLDGPATRVSLRRLINPINIRATMRQENGEEKKGVQRALF